MLEWGSAHQLDFAINEARIGTYEWYEKFVEKYPMSKIIVVPSVAVADGVLCIASRIAVIGEATFKGFGSMLGTISYKSCEKRLDCRQFFKVAFDHLLSIPATVISSIFRVILNIFNLSFNKDYPNQRIKEIKLAYDLYFQIKYCESSLIYIANRIKSFEKINLGMQEQISIGILGKQIASYKKNVQELESADRCLVEQLLNDFETRLENLRRKFLYKL
jgi:hypothetical protein